MYKSYIRQVEDLGNGVKKITKMDTSTYFADKALGAIFKIVFWPIKMVLRLALFMVAFPFVSIWTLFQNGIHAKHVLVRILTVVITILCILALLVLGQSVQST